MNTLPAYIHQAIKRLPELTRRVAVQAADEFDQNFTRQAFFNQRWQSSKRQQREGGSTLIKTGDLRRSVRYDVTADRITFYSSRPDAVIHNEGGTVRPRVTPQMRKWAWAMHKKTGESKFKGLALTSKTQLTIRIPQRQYVGQHPMLDAAIERTITKFLNSIL